MIVRDIIILFFTYIVFSIQIGSRVSAFNNEKDSERINEYTIIIVILEMLILHILYGFH